MKNWLLAILCKNIYESLSKQLRKKPLDIACQIKINCSKYKYKSRIVQTLSFSLAHPYQYFKFTKLKSLQRRFSLLHSWWCRARKSQKHLATAVAMMAVHLPGTHKERKHNELFCKGKRQEIMVVPYEQI